MTCPSVSQTGANDLFSSPQIIQREANKGTVVCLPDTHVVASLRAVLPFVINSSNGNLHLTGSKVILSDVDIPTLVILDHRTSCVESDLSVEIIQRSVQSVGLRWIVVGWLGMFVSIHNVFKVGLTGKSWHRDIGVGNGRSLEEEEEEEEGVVVVRSGMEGDQVTCWYITISIT
jgi:hypothetical protein